MYKKPTTEQMNVLGNEGRWSWNVVRDGLLREFWPIARAPVESAGVAMSPTLCGASAVKMSATFASLCKHSSMSSRSTTATSSSSGTQFSMAPHAERKIYSRPALRRRNNTKCRDQATTNW
eukprot:CAMPEP_0204214878 /NCGR_PEP_ID=MMETSP0361-20130328/77028_1 /ASSEMBLY_ACC=CAM_ASM_000343 /TAXON_ID=268821 /ORGANISM="Scrippsiella Hangoei, Strain SHTV-5" /LENGTH=120 /DNA_ID=CAMNT_0051179553 /DNA_START=135 /DNA_END=494 /DNA_ORIENTATION=-